jgi:valyl-tRNA synthetase
LRKIAEEMVRLEARLVRPDFLEKAPEEVIEKEQAQHQGMRQRAGKLAQVLESTQ